MWLQTNLVIEAIFELKNRKREHPIGGKSPKPLAHEISKFLKGFLA